MKIFCQHALLWIPLVAAAFADTYTMRGQQRQQQRRLQASGEAAYAPIPLNKLKNFVVTIEQGSTGSFFGTTFFILSPDIAGSASSVTCTATLNQGGGDYDLQLELRKEFYPNGIDFDCRSSSTTSLPDEESCTVDGFPSDSFQTVHGALVVIDTSGTGVIGDFYTVEVLCTADTPAPTPMPTTPMPTTSIPTTPMPTVPIPTQAPVTEENSGGGGACFSEKGVVIVWGQGPTTMKDLNVGQKVLVNPTGTYETVYGFAHLDLKKEMKFLQLYFKQQERPLEVTHDHLLMGANGHMLPAKAFHVGDSVTGVMGPTEINDIELVTRRGLYAPLTLSGTVVVDGTVASNYILLQKHSTSEYLQILGLDTPVTQHDMIHLFLSPIRMACSGIHADFCTTVYPDSGYPSFVSGGIALWHWVEEQSSILQVLLYVIFLVFWGSFYALECALDNATTPIFIALVVATTVTFKCCYPLATKSKAND